MDGHEQDVGAAKETDISKELAELSEELPVNEATAPLGPKFDRFWFLKSEVPVWGSCNSNLRAIEPKSLRLRPRQPESLSPDQFSFPILGTSLCPLQERARAGAHGGRRGHVCDPV